MSTARIFRQGIDDADRPIPEVFPFSICENRMFIPGFKGSIIRTCRVWFRLYRYWAYPWRVVLMMPIQLLRCSGTRRVQEQVRGLSALSRIDWAKFYELLNDLLW